MKTAKQILFEYIPSGRTEDGKDFYTESQVLMAMNEFANQFIEIAIDKHIQKHEFKMPWRCPNCQATDTDYCLCVKGF